MPWRILFIRDMHPFEQIFRENLSFFFRRLESSGVTGERRILAAVSGGADSVFLLKMLADFSREFDFRLAAVTVDHRIRPAEESSSDADFVEGLCASFSPPVLCFRVELGEGSVSAEAEKRGMGIEEAARFLRYRAFYEKASGWGACGIMTGHTSSDQLETLLMRFLQGAGFSGVSGINPARDILFRPMLSLSGEDVRGYLRSAGISWREDSSNSDDGFLRNRIRLKLVPVLDREFPGWRKAALCGLEKSSMDFQALSSFPLPEWKEFPVPVGLCFSCTPGRYFSMLPAFRLRFLYQGFSLLGIKKRIPYRLVRGMIFGSSADTGLDGGNGIPPGEKSFRTGFSVRGSGVFFEVGKNHIFLGLDIVHNHKNGYLVYVAGAGTVALPFGDIKIIAVPEQDGGVFFERYPERNLHVPFVIRSRLPDDSVTGEGGIRHSLKKLFNGWGVPGFLRDFVPVVEERGVIRAVLGSFAGFSDFFSRMQ